MDHSRPPPVFSPPFGSECTSEDYGSDVTPTGEVSDLSRLFDRLNAYVDQTDRDPSQIFKDLSRTPKSLRSTMFEIMEGKKEELAPILNLRADLVKRANDTSKLNNMLFECLSGADLGPPSPEPGDTVMVSDDDYKLQLQAIKMKHTRMLEDLEDSKVDAANVYQKLVHNQTPYRPISKLDHRRMIETTDSQYSEVEECIKKSTVNAVMLINNKCLDARRRRRNFSKETTEVLTQWFNEHLDHPYPSEEEKNELADICGITPAQINNWFGNRRVRQKRQADRPLQPPSPKKVTPSPQKMRRASEPQHDRRGQQMETRPPMNPQEYQHARALQLQQRRQSANMQHVQQQQQHAAAAAGRPRQLVAVPYNSGMQQQQLQQPIFMPHPQSFHNMPMDQFEPQGMRQNGGFGMEQYQMGMNPAMMNNMNGDAMQHSAQYTVGDKSYTAL